MNLRKFTAIGIIMLGAVAVTSCSDENNSETESTYKGEKVNFAIAEGNSTSAPLSRVDYDGLNDGKWSIVWNNGDKVNIHKHHGGDPQMETYTVTPLTDNASRGSLTAVNKTDLTWTEGVQSEELFSTVYPSSADMTDNENIRNNEVVVKYNVNQSGSVNNNVVACDMENMRMLGHTMVKKTQDAVTFHLDPVTTTLKIVVNGPASGSVAFSSVVVQIANNKYIANDGSVRYKYDNDAQRFIPVVNVDAPKSINFIVGVDNDTDFIDLAAGESISLTALIPGVEYAAGDVKISIHMGGYSKALKSQAFEASGYYTIQTPQVPTGGDDDWITPLDDNILVSGMSLPGASDAGSYNSSIWHQTMDIPSLWKKGIRAFHFENYNATVAYVKDSYYWGIYSTAYTSTYSYRDPYGKQVKQIWDAVNGTKEFAVIVVKHAKRATDALFSNYGNNLTKCYNKLIGEGVQFVEFKKGMTIGDCRGKIVLMQYETAGFTAGANASGWATTVDQIYTKNLVNKSNVDCGKVSILDAYVQDDNEMSINYDKLTQLMKNNMGQAATRGADNWTITNMAHVVTFPITDSRHTAQGSRALMNSMQHWFAASNGNIGIVLIPFIGQRTINSGAETNTVYGDIISKTIIDKNYRFTPLKKQN